MFYIKMADLLICIDNHYEYVKNMCRDYIVEPEAVCSESTEPARADMYIQVSCEDIEKEQEESRKSQGIEYPMPYCESICIYRSISRKLINFDGILLHGACIEMDGKVYVFCAKSGTGKSTHLALWKKVYGSRVHIINGDKPIIRYLDGQFIVYGTPWCGKEGWNINTKAPLAAVCYLKRGESNQIHSFAAGEAVKLIVNQILLPKDKSEIIRYLDLLDKMLKDIPGYELFCNMDEEAAVVAYEGMKLS